MKYLPRLFRSLFWTALASALLPATGCGSDAEGDGGPSPEERAIQSAEPVPLEEFCSRAVALRCEASAACCSDPERQYASHDACVAAEQALCEDYSLPLLETPGFAYDPLLGGQLLALQQLAAGDCGAPSRSIADAVVPALGAGQPCSLEVVALTGKDACQPGLYCSIPAGETEGTCVAFGAAGASCDSATRCGEGLRCVDSACEPLPAPGDRCKFGDVCAEGRCMIDVAATEAQYEGLTEEEILFRELEGGLDPIYVCQAPRGRGAACIMPEECASNFCDIDTAIAQMAEVARCAACSTHEDCRFHDPEAWCDAGVCQTGAINRPTLAPCDQAAECQSLSCNGGRCDPVSPNQFYCPSPV